MKKKVTLGICLAAGMGLFIACGDSNDDGSSGGGSGSSGNKTTANDSSGNETPSSSSAANSGNSENGDSATNNDSGNSGDQTLTRQTLVDGTTATKAAADKQCKAMGKMSRISSATIVMFIDLSKSTSGATCTSLTDACKNLQDVEQKIKQAGVNKTDVTLVSKGFIMPIPNIGGNDGYSAAFMGSGDVCSEN
ncbi:MAG: hypothetical protein AAF320_06960 [Myxococcota bacterium]